MKHRFLPNICLALVLAGCGRSPPQRVTAPAKPINGKLRVQRLVKQPATTVDPGDELDIGGTFELDDPSLSPPHGVANIVRVEGGRKTICDSQSITPTRDPKQDKLARFQCRLHAPEKPGKYNIEVRAGRDSVASIDLEVAGP